jgi:hypothetical protein
MPVKELEIPVTMSQEGKDRAELDPEGTRDLLSRLVHPRTGFREFLRYWYFIPEGSGKRLLGDELWAAQEEFADVCGLYPWVYFLKARQLGESTIACAFDGYRARFGQPNSRVHIMSRTDEEAKGLLRDVKLGLSYLPLWLRLDVTKDRENEIVFRGTGEDSRTIHAYATSRSPGRGETCTHAHVDEWAAMEQPGTVWQAVEPGIKPGGTCHIITTGVGPENFTMEYYRRTEAGDTPFHPCFVDALQRPDRTPAWLAAKRRSTPDEASFMREYPMTVQDAMSGGGAYKFTKTEIDMAGVDFRGVSEWKKGRKYCIGGDIGRHQDAAVFTVLDVTEDVHDVVFYLRLREQPYPVIQGYIKQIWEAYRKPPMGIEKNAAGEAVLENLDMPEHVIEAAKFTTSKASKARIIDEVKLMLQNQCLKWDPVECAQLDKEMRGYQVPDDNVVQDSVISLAIAEEFADQAYSSGTVVGILHV